MGLGLVPIRPDGTCRFAAVDIDIDTIDHQALYKKVTARKFPLSVCRSKSGGAHLYLFMKEPGLPASQVIPLLKKWAALLGYPSSEIFPKQTKITKKNIGNWINLPYFSGGGTTRYAFQSTGAMNLEEFLDAVEFYDPAICSADEDIALEPASPSPSKAVIMTKGSGVPYAQAQGSLARALAILENTAETVPGRNNQLFRSARELGYFIKNGQLDRRVVESKLTAKALESGLEESETRATIHSGIEIALSSEPRSHLTDLGNAQRLVLRHGANIRYSHLWKTWLYWDGTRWRRDETGEIQRLARETVQTIYQEAGNEFDAANRKKLASWAGRSEFEARLRAMVSLAQAEPGIPVTPAELATDPFLLNCLNGTVDLRTAELREHRREDLITKIVPIDYDPGARCPRFQRFLLEIMAGAENMLRYLQRLLGYMCTGSTRERTFYLLYGSGDNGKTTLIEIVKRVLGEYAETAEFSTFLEQRTERVRDDLADLAGARFVSGIEVPAGKLLAESLLKQLTGGEDEIKARRLFSPYFKYKPQYKIALVGNHKPIIRGTDNAIWNRVHLIPFEVVIPKEKQDRELLGKLKTELPGILAWALQGCLEWQRRGLDPPQEILAATGEYRQEMDTLGAFLAECCVERRDAYVRITELYEVYVDWCGHSYRLSRTNFGLRLKDRGFTQGRRGKGGYRVWTGLGLLGKKGQLPLTSGGNFDDSEF